MVTVNLSCITNTVSDKVLYKQCSRTNQVELDRYIEKCCLICFSQKNALFDIKYEMINLYAILSRLKNTQRLHCYSFRRCVVTKFIVKSTIREIKLEELCGTEIPLTSVLQNGETVFSRRHLYPAVDY